MVLAAAVVLSLLATALLAASKNWQNAGLGDLSQYYETGNSADPGYVSTVRGDSGGTSYGIYMFASNAGHAPELRPVAAGVQVRLHLPRHGRHAV